VGLTVFRAKRKAAEQDASTFDAFYPAAMTSSEEVDGGTTEDSWSKYLTPSGSLSAWTPEDAA